MSLRPLLRNFFALAELAAADILWQRYGTFWASSDVELFLLSYYWFPDVGNGVRHGSPPELDDGAVGVHKASMTGKFLCVCDDTVNYQSHGNPGKKRGPGVLHYGYGSTRHKRVKR